MKKIWFPIWAAMLALGVWWYLKPSSAEGILQPGDEHAELDLAFPPGTDVELAGKVLKFRMERAGAQEVRVQKTAPEHLRLQIANVQSSAIVASLAGMQGLIGFHLVDDDSTWLKDGLAALPEPEREGVQPADHPQPNASLTATDPVRLREVCQRIATRANPEQAVFIGIEQHLDRSLAHVLRTERLMNNAHIAQARPAFDEADRPFIELHLTPEGAGLFEQITAENKGRRLAVVFDQSVLMAPVIQEKISGGVISLTVPFLPDPDTLRLNQLTLAFLMGMQPLPARPEVRTVRSD